MRRRPARKPRGASGPAGEGQPGADDPPLLPKDLAQAAGAAAPPKELDIERIERWLRARYGGRAALELAEKLYTRLLLLWVQDPAHIEHWPAYQARVLKNAAAAWFRRCKALGIVFRPLETALEDGAEPAWEPPRERDEEQLAFLSEVLALLEKTLEGRLREVLALRFQEHLPLAEVARRLGIQWIQVARAEERILLTASRIADGLQGGALLAPAPPSA